ncbi:sialate O-acetylesterase [Halalkalibaculum sp. DA384]|uniref:sialate O-acetylesterase n=1 Tax=Halalkalibaculum sp. DA384 TaxID=3373606 RepID=UPI0037551C9C
MTDDISRSSLEKESSSGSYPLYILAGQSNMDGMGFVSELPPDLNRTQENVLIYNPNRKDDGEPPEDIGRWVELGPGHGYGHRFTRNEEGEMSLPSGRFGPELAFAARIRTLHAGRGVALLKYARSGSSIHPETPDDWGCWDPDVEDVNQWTHFKYHYRRAVSRAGRDRDGEVLKLSPAGILWVQGESDAAYTKEIAEAYEENLEKIIGRMRKLTGHPQLPVVIAGVSETGREEGRPALPWAGIVRQAQEKVAGNDACAAFVRPPEGHGWIDPWHYDSQTYIELGRRMAEAMAELVS